MKKVLVATIGTRELMFRVDDTTWYNAGNDRQDDDIISQQNQVTESLNLNWEQYKSYRRLTKYLLDNFEQYQEQIKPVIWGKLFQDLKEDIEKVYLLATDQPETIPYREKDTIYASQIIAQYLEKLGLSVEVITFGRNGINPSDFEQMFQWWQGVWDKRIIVGEHDLVLCLKGGVGQTAEAGRTSALGFFGERVEFYDSQENPCLNQKGIPSEYIGPTFGANYLWSRVQKQALGLLKNYNYLAVQGLLEPYFKQDTKGWSSIPVLLKGAIAWNQGQFKTFFKYVKNDLDNSQKQQDQNYWWQAYEQAYTAVIRLKQNNITEAMQHSFRAVEGLLYQWLQEELDDYLVLTRSDEYPLIKHSILEKYPDLRSLFIEFDPQRRGTIQARLKVLAALIAHAQPETFESTAFQAWNSLQARRMRNEISHRLGGITEQSLFSAWGSDIETAQHWEKRLLDCLNQITGERFFAFQNASILPIVQHQIQKAIVNYNPIAR